MTPDFQTHRLRDGNEVEAPRNLSLLPAVDDPPRIAGVARDIGEIAPLRRTAEILDAGPPHANLGQLSAAMQEIMSAAELVAQDGHATVLLLGETGVGKSWLARRIHQRGPRAQKAFLDINCAGLSPQLLESELFGYERGAFTGATGTKRGLVEAADGGTLMLDEIGELPINVQAQLLTFLDERRFRRVGGTRIIQADVRIVAATNVSLAERVARGQFRKDLYYRLSVVPIAVPPLRERSEEIAALARSIVTDLVRRASRRIAPPLAPDLIAALERYDWPGNLRELRNALERGLLLSRGETLSLCHMPPEIRAPAVEGGPPLRLDDVVRAHILRMLGSCSGNRTRAAEVLGITRATLTRNLAEMARAGLPVPFGNAVDDAD